jgi:glycosyltransferase involved in cell wall biosynthesis
MRILFSHYLLDDDSPPAWITRTLTAEFRALGHEVELHRSAGSPRGGGNLASRPGGGRPSAVQRVRDRLWFARAMARDRRRDSREREAIARFRPDVVLARHDAYCGSMTRAAVRAGVPLVVYVDAPAAYETRIHNTARRWHPPGLVEWMEGRALRPARALTANSHPTAEIVRGAYGLTAPIVVTGNGLHPEHFPARDESRRQDRLRALGIDPSACVLGFQGTFRAFHGIDRLGELMRALADRTDAHWMLIGDGPERARLEAEVRGQVRATFLGRRDPEEMGGLLTLVDVAVVPHAFLPGPFYLSPMKVVECAAAGCAVVASAQGDIPRLLDEGRSGVTLDTPEIAVWAEAIRGLIDDPERRCELGRRARGHVHGQLTWRHVALRYLEVLASAVGDGQPLIGAATSPNFPDESSAPSVAS